MYLRLANYLGASVPAQLLAVQLLPHLDDLAARRRTALSTSGERAVTRMRADLPDWRVGDPAGGSVIWAELPVADTGAYVLLAARHGVHVAPGSILTAARSANPHVRICVDRPWPVVDEGIDRLALAWRELAAAPRPVLADGGHRMGPVPDASIACVGALVRRLFQVLEPQLDAADRTVPGV